MKEHTTSLFHIISHYAFSFSLLEMIALMYGLRYILDKPLKAQCVQNFFTMSHFQYPSNIWSKLFEQLKPT